MSKYILVFDTCDPYICPLGCHIFNNYKELQYYYDEYGIDEGELVFKTSKEMNFKKIISKEGS